MSAPHRSSKLVELDLECARLAACAPWMREHITKVTTAVLCSKPFTFV